MTTPIVVPQSPMGLGDVFSASFSIVKRRFSRLVVIALVQQLVTAMFALPVVLFAMLVMLPQLEYTSSGPSNGYLASSGIGTAIGAVFGLAATVVSVYFQGLLVHASHQALLNQDPAIAGLREMNRGILRRRRREDRLSQPGAPHRAGTGSSPGAGAVRMAGAPLVARVGARV